MFAAVDIYAFESVGHHPCRVTGLPFFVHTLPAFVFIIINVIISC
jgi:hypothetical protein